MEKNESQEASRHNPKQDKKLKSSTRKLDIINNNYLIMTDS